MTVPFGRCARSKRISGSSSDVGALVFCSPSDHPKNLSTNIRNARGATYNAGVPRGGYVTLDYGESGPEWSNTSEFEPEDIQERCPDVVPLGLRERRDEGAQVGAFHNADPLGLQHAR